MNARAPIIVCPLQFERRVLTRTGLGSRVRIETCGPGREGVLRWAGHNRQAEGPVILAGVAGGLVDELVVGDAFVVDAVVAPGGKRIETTWRPPECVDHALLSVTSKTRAVTSLPAKRALHTTTGASLVDLESQSFAEVGRDLGWTFGIIRGISDSVEQPLPPGCDNWVDHHGRAAFRPIAAALLRSPSILKRMRELQRASEAAMTSVGTILRQAIESESA